MWEAIAVLAGALVTLLGVYVKGRLDIARLEAEHARKDHEHRQAYYHDVQTLTASLIQLTWEAEPSEAAGVQHVVEAQFLQAVKGIRTFGTDGAQAAARDLDEAWERGDKDAMQEAAAALESAAREDVAPK